jgi:hypothetical protein
MESMTLDNAYRRAANQIKVVGYLVAGVLAAVVSVSNAGAEEAPDASTVADGTKQIDRLIRRGWTENNITPAARCSDRAFVRRVYLDLAGRVPTLTEVSEFLLDQREDRRRQLVDLLLASEDHVQHFADLFDTLLMGRVEESQYSERVKHGWRAYLETALREDRPWNDVAKEILLARPEDESKYGSVWFLYERNDSHQAIAEAVAPAFFGVRVECAQCHDHMLVDEIKQEHYWGLVAFFNRGQNKKTKSGPRVIESAIGGFSEFANLSGDSTPNRWAFLDAATVEEQRPGKDEKQEDADELYVNANVDDEPRVPIFSRRQRFVDDIVNGHPLLARAMVNRLWAMLLGRGIVHPYDEMDSVHPPSHSELLDWLAADFEANGFRIKHTLRLIAKSEAYQLTSIRPDGVDDPSSFAWYLERSLTAEQLARSVQLVLRGKCSSDDPIVGSFRQQFLDVLPDENIVTISDALFLTNNPQFDAFLNASWEREHLLKQLSGLESHRDRANLLFQSILSRSPDADEVAVIAAYLDKRQDSLEMALQQVAWSLITSAEFRFNH